MSPVTKIANTCCILLTNNNHPGHVSEPLKNAIRFLIRTYHVSHFTVLQKSGDNINIMMIQSFADCYARHFEHIIVEKAASTEEQFLRDAKALIAKSTFCICDLNSESNASEIKKYTAASKWALLVDVG